MLSSRDRLPIWAIALSATAESGIDWWIDNVASGKHLYEIMSSRHARMLRPQEPLIVFDSESLFSNIVLDFWKEERRQGATEGLAETMCMTGSRSRRGWVVLCLVRAFLFGLDDYWSPLFSHKWRWCYQSANLQKDLHIPKRPGHFDFYFQQAMDIS